MMKVGANNTLLQTLRHIRSRPVLMISFAFIVLMSLLALLAQWVAPYSFETQHLDSVLNEPNWNHWLGTDKLGRDVLSRIIYGARMSMSVGVFTALISLFVGVIYGLIAGWIGGKVETVMMRFIDVLYAIPSLVLLIMVKVAFDSFNLNINPELRALFSILIALSLVGWVSLARLVRAQVLQIKQNQYIEAAQSIGAGHIRIIRNHILPNIIGPIIVLLTFQIPSNILYESFLSFIGLGLQPPYSSWGVLADEGWRSLRSYPHLVIAPGVAMFLTMLSFNLLGDGLRDAFDPQSRNR